MLFFCYKISQDTVGFLCVEYGDCSPSIPLYEPLSTNVELEINSVVNTGTPKTDLNCFINADR